MYRIFILLGFVGVLQTGLNAQKVSIDSLKQVLSAHPQEDSLRIKLLIDLSYEYRFTDMAAAIQTIQEAADLAIALKNDHLSTSVFYNQGDLCFMQQENQKAYDYLQQALQITLKYNDKVWIGKRYIIQSLLAGVLGQSNPPLAFQYLRESIHSLRVIGKTDKICQAISNLASLHAELNQLDSAAYYYGEAIDCIKQQVDQTNLPVMQMYYAHCLSNQQNYKKALSILESTTAAFRKSEDPYQLKNSLFLLADTYVNLDKLKAAKNTMDEAVAIKAEFPFEESIHTEFYVHYYEKTHQLDSALFYMKKYQDLEQAEFEKDRKNALEEQEIRFRTKEKEAENRQLEQNLAKSKLQNIILYIGLGFLFIVFLLITYFWDRLRKANRQIKAAANKTAQVVASKRLMTNLMAHDLRAPLQAIQINAAMLKIRQPDSAEAIYIELAAQRIHQMALRIVEVQNEEQIDIEKRLTNVPVQTAIAQVAEQFELLAVSKKVHIQIEPNEQAPVAIAEPALLDNILGNLVSNAIKYSPPGGKITLKMKKMQDKVQILIEDEGPGLDLPIAIAGDEIKLSQQASESGWGIGLKLTKQYVEMMGGQLFLQTNSALGATFVVELMGANE
jgi:signal transduction histidine kinase